MRIARSVQFYGFGDPFLRVEWLKPINIFLNFIIQKFVVMYCTLYKADATRYFWYGLVFPWFEFQTNTIKGCKPSLQNASSQSCAKLVGFEIIFGFEIKIYRKYRYRIDIVFETALTH